MSEVSVFTIEDLRRDLANLHTNGVTYANNPYSHLAERRLMAVISELEKTPQRLKLTIGSSEAEGIAIIDQYVANSLFPPESVIELGEIQSISRNENSTFSCPPIIYGGPSRYLGFSAITKTLAHNGQLQVAPGAA